MPVPQSHTRRYHPISDYGIIGDMYSAALVAHDGAIDWCCLPRFDSSPIFHRLLDADDGGFFVIQPTQPFAASQSYIESTNVLQTTFSTNNGKVELTDLMSVRKNLDSSSRLPGTKILRRIKGINGTVDLKVIVKLTFDWNRKQPIFEHRSWGVLVSADDETLGVSAPFEFEQNDTNSLVAACTVEAGDELWVCIEYEPGPENDNLESAPAQLERTIAHWQDWISRCNYNGPHTELVTRSALVLKLLTYAPTGAVIAAPTTSLPEDIGGIRNWDYRYVWLRDAGLILTALQGLDYHNEAMEFWGWLEALHLSGEHPVQNIYRVNGKAQLPEQRLDHLQGYKCSQPVRTGNGAVKQLQLDLFGYIIETALICQSKMREPHPDLKHIIAFFANQAAQRWPEPDHGIWEMRSAPRQLVHSKLMCWVALDRAMQLHQRGWLDGDSKHWKQARQNLRNAIEQRGFNKKLGAFTQAFEGDQLDASTLLIPLVGFLPGSDPRVHSTIDRIQAQLVEDALVKRYRTSDGLPGNEGTFLLCSFWLVSALAVCGRWDEAYDLFEEITSRANTLGLFAEQISHKDGKFLGNFPQGLSHLALIDAALRLNQTSPPKAHRHP